MHKTPFQVTFEGGQGQHEFDALDVGNVFVGTAQALNQILVLKDGPNAAKDHQVMVGYSHKGSLAVDLAIAVTQAAAPLLPYLPGVIKTGSDALSILKAAIDVKVALKGKKPEKVKFQDGSVTVVGNNNQIIKVDKLILEVVSDRIASRAISKIAQPLLQSRGLKAVKFAAGKKKFKISRKEAQYLVEDQELQTLGDVKYRGIVRKIDRDTKAGFLTANKKRISFIYTDQLPQSKFDILAESLRIKRDIILVGDLTMDLVGNPKTLQISDVLWGERLI